MNNNEITAQEAFWLYQQHYITEAELTAYMELRAKIIKDAVAKNNFDNYDDCAKDNVDTTIQMR